MQYILMRRRLAILAKEKGACPKFNGNDLLSKALMPIDYYKKDLDKNFCSEPFNIVMDRPACRIKTIRFTQNSNIVRPNALWDIFTNIECHQLVLNHHVGISVLNQGKERRIETGCTWIRALKDKYGIVVDLTLQTKGILQLTGIMQKNLLDQTISANYRYVLISMEGGKVPMKLLLQDFYWPTLQLGI